MGGLVQQLINIDSQHSLAAITATSKHERGHLVS